MPWLTNEQGVRLDISFEKFGPISENSNQNKMTSRIDIYNSLNRRIIIDSPEAFWQVQMKSNFRRVQQKHALTSSWRHRDVIH